MASKLALLAVLLFTLSPRSDAFPKIIPKLGPCSKIVKETIYFNDLDSLYSRETRSKTDTILMYMSNNITVDAPALLDEGFSCTIIKPDPALNGDMPFFITPTQNHTVLIINATNLIINGIGFEQNWSLTMMSRCVLPGSMRPWWFLGGDGYFDREHTCAGLVVYRSFNVQISKSVIRGRVDLIKVGACDLSYSDIYYDNDLNWAISWAGAPFGTSIRNLDTPLNYGLSFGAVRLILSGDNTNLVRANNRITNNYIRGCFTSVILYMGAVGNIVQNNYITGYRFSGLQCGQGMSQSADCMLNTFELNYITPDLSVPVHSDGAGIYYDLHWVNPANRDSCNYMWNTYPRCYYIDYTTSGLLVEGAVCIMNNGRRGDWYGNSSGPGGAQGGNVLKLNTGKMNVLKSVIYVHNGQRANLGIFACQNWCENRCGDMVWNDEGNAWGKAGQITYNNELWRQNFPYMSTICTDKGYFNDGVYYSCAPNISTVPSVTTLPKCYDQLVRLTNGMFKSPTFEKSGNCSGWPVLNDIDFIFVTNFTTTSTYFNGVYPMDIQDDCLPLGDTIRKLNKLNLAPPRNMPDTLGFNDEWGGDYGADDPSALVYQKYPDFYSCPRRLAGPQTASFASTRSEAKGASMFNKFPPGWIHKPVHPSVGNSVSKEQVLAYAEKLTRGMDKGKGQGKGKAPPKPKPCKKGKDKNGKCKK